MSDTLMYAVILTIKEAKHEEISEFLLIKTFIFYFKCSMISYGPPNFSKESVGPSIKTFDDSHIE